MSSFDGASCDLKSLFYEAAINDEDSSGVQRSIFLCIAVSLLTFCVSTVTGNYSQVDKIWSITPFVYACLMVSDARTFLMAGLATVWGIRLTWNFNRRGGYAWPPWQGDEDYRWKIVQDGFLISWTKKPMVWMAFNLFFISFYQNFLLWLIAAPSIVSGLVASSCGKSPLNPIDLLASVMLLSSVVLESIADNQQFVFQTEKYRQRKDGVPLKGEYLDGFKQSGLFAVVRKPNYSGEQLVWMSFYLFSVAATRGEQLLNWSGPGWVLLCLLFQGSGMLTENISIKKYPKYTEYQKRVPLYFPDPFRFISAIYKAKAS